MLEFYFYTYLYLISFRFSDQNLRLIKLGKKIILGLKKNYTIFQE